MARHPGGRRVKGIRRCNRVSPAKGGRLARACVQAHTASVATIVYGDFEWDDAKAATNLSKHGISFEEAVTAVVDPNALFLADDSGSEQRGGLL